MYRAIIVDDESKICQLIRCLGDWEKLGIEIIDVCQDGEAALEGIVKHKPDIVLTDIRMPVYDGLEIIQQVRKLQMDTVFIVISGYKQFEYARQALQYGVVDFLVKPINKEDLNIALQKAIGDLVDQKNVQNVNEILYSKEIQEKEALLSRLTSETDLENSGNKEKVKVGQLFKKDIFQAVIIKTNKKELNLASSKFSEDLLNYLRRTIITGEAISVAKDDGIYLLLNYQKGDEKAIKSELYNILKHMGRGREIYGLFETTIGVGVPVNHIEDMKNSIQTAKTAWQNRVLFASKEYLEYDKLNICTEGRSVFWEEKEWMDFQTALESCNQTVIRELLGRMEAGINREKQLYLTGFFNHVKRIVASVEKLVAENKTLVGTKRIEQIMEEFRCGDTISDIFLHMNLYISKTLQAYYDRKNAMKKQPIIKAEEYISQNYMQDISLEDMAQLVGLSGAYFSKLFKSVEGMNYIDYLTQVRLDHSKKLLITTNMSIKSIAATVGYLDEKYFRKLFKKVVGIKPSEYRKLH
ncbi:MAG: response regulator [Lachnospiraceae bacterium]|nr:response regulator [Lachnospiraceae bacterium]